MAHLDRIRTPGAWIFNSTVDPAEFEAVDANLAKCINGDDGGVWAPASVIQIGGSGLKIIGGADLIIEDGGSFGNEAGTSYFANIQAHNIYVQPGYATSEFESPLLVSGATNTFEADGPATFNGVTTFGSTVNFNSNVNLGNDAGDIVVINGTVLGGDAQFTGDVVAGTLQSNGIGLFSGTVTMSHNAIIGTTAADTATLKGVLACSTTGHVRSRVAWAADGDINPVSLSYTDRLAFQNDGVLSANRTWWVDSVGAAAGDVMKLSRRRETSAFTITVKRTSDSTTLITLDQTTIRWCELVYTGTQWEVAEHQ